MSPELHPELIAAKRAIALATTDKKLYALQTEALRLAPLVTRNEIAKPDAVDALIDAARANDLYGTTRDRDNAEHIIGMGINGRSAGVGYAPPMHKCTNGDGAQSDQRSGLFAGYALKPLDLSEFLSLKLPPRRHIIKPWLPEKGLAQIYSPRGVGKTLLGLTIGYAVASANNFLGWEVPEPRKVLYVDGEMPAETMQERLALIAGAFEKKLPSGNFFRMLSADVSERGLPDLATPEGQRALDAVVDDAELLMLDNLSTLCRSGNENEAESWRVMQEWILAHRRARRAVVFHHHAGKAGAQRGTSKREDVLDTVIALRRPMDYRPEEGARFELHFEKTRGLFGADAESFEARYEVRDGAAVWTRKVIGDLELERVVEVMRDGMSIRDAADALGMDKSKVARLKAKAKEKGLLA
jgi:putative DNA primase/helicase